MLRVHENSSKDSPSLTLLTAFAALLLPVVGAVTLLSVYVKWLAGSAAPYVLCGFALILTVLIYRRRTETQRKLVKATFDVILSIWAAAATAFNFANVYLPSDEQFGFTKMLEHVGPHISAILFGLLMGAAIGRCAIALVDWYEGFRGLRTPAVAK